MSLLSPADPPPVTVENPAGRAPLLILADHARPTIPERLGDLGVCAAGRSRHIAYDIGIEGVARTLAEQLDAPLVLAGFSRLVVDLNRRPGDEDCMPPVSDGTPVPGNRDLSPAARAARITEIHSPYHARIAGLLDGMRGGGAVPVVISMHSFTPVFAGFVRPWHIGVLWNRDQRLAAPVLEALRRAGDLCVGDNQPYSGRDGHGYTLPRHAEASGLPHLLFEIRQDLIDHPGRQHGWGQRLAGLLRPILADMGRS